MAQISDLIGGLEKNWPSLTCPSSDDTKFWTHEWEKHGTCSESELDQHEYFEAALKLKQKVNLLQILENAGKVYVIAWTFLLCNRVWLMMRKLSCRNQAKQRVL